MATRTEVRLIDDLDGESPADETVHFALDRTHYEIDLSDYHAKALRENFADYISSARKVSVRTARTAAPKGRAGASADPQQLQAIRAWARAHGYQVADRGRIPAAVVDAYHAGA